MKLRASTQAVTGPVPHRQPRDLLDVAWAALATLMVLGCAVDPGVDQRQTRVTIVTQNLGNLTDDATGSAIRDYLTAVTADVAAFQEVGERRWLIDNLPEGYSLSRPPRAGVGLVFDRRRWTLDDEGEVILGENDDGWGERVALWAKLSNSIHQITVVSTHWCVPIRTSTDRCDERQQVYYANRVLDLLGDIGDAFGVVAGDLNVFDGFEDGEVITHILDRGMVDTLSAAGGTGATFVGNDWAPAGRIDYIFTTPAFEVVSAAIAPITVATGGDHFAVQATLALP